MLAILLRHHHRHFQVSNLLQPLSMATWLCLADRAKLWLYRWGQKERVTSTFPLSSSAQAVITKYYRLGDLHKQLFSHTSRSYKVQDQGSDWLGSWWSLSSYVMYIYMKVAQSCLTLCDPMDYAYTVPGILQAKILEWVAFPFSRGSSQPRDRTQVSYIAGRFFTSCTTWEAQEYWNG